MQATLIQQKCVGALKDEAKLASMTQEDTTKMVGKAMSVIFSCLKDKVLR